MTAMLGGNSGLPYRQLGGTGWSISAVGLGCASYWARPEFPERRARSVLEAAIECGVNVFDTGGSYARGHAELRLGRLLEHARLDPNTTLISTKVGSICDSRGRIHKDFSPKGLVQQTEASLRRLGRERIELLFIHGPTANDINDGMLASIDNMRQAGKLRFAGVNGSEESISRALETRTFDVIMPFYSVMKITSSSLIDNAGRAGIGVMAAEPLGRMAFAPPLLRWLRSRSGLWYMARLLHHKTGVAMTDRSFRKTLRHEGWTRAQLAISWVLNNPSVHCALAGTTRPEHIRELCEAASRPFPDRVNQEIQLLHDAHRS